MNGPVGFYLTVTEVKGLVFLCKIKVSLKAGGSLVMSLDQQFLSSLLV